MDATLDENTEAPAGDEEESEGGGLNAKKIILFIVLPLFTLLGAGGGLYFTGALDKFLKKEPTEEHASADDHGAAVDSHGKPADDGHGGPPKTVFFLEIPDISVNLADTGSKPSYLRLKVQLELANQGDLAAVEAVMPRVVDQFQTYLRELRVRDLRGSAGIYRLQMELLTRVNSAVAPVEVKDVLFQEILIQ
ncbi:MAG: flagellar basal body-associated FliL family protein [Alphaproteobacteria bacterium]|nr:flagellar basal body-associated FliL family protein [Alphaproteobacteria bacterium]